MSQISYQVTVACRRRTLPLVCKAWAQVARSSSGLWEAFELGNDKYTLSNVDYLKVCRLKPHSRSDRLSDCPSHMSLLVPTCANWCVLAPTVWFERVTSGNNKHSIPSPSHRSGNLSYSRFNRNEQDVWLIVTCRSCIGFNREALACKMHPSLPLLDGVSLREEALLCLRKCLTCAVSTSRHLMTS